MKLSNTLKGGHRIMEKEYDFSKAEQGKFYRPIEELEIPVYLDKRVKNYFNQKAMEKNVELGEIINAVLLKEMKLSSAEGKT
jgi:hypothetical protein